jgi:class 3 adenylate cyclase/tetratricopeptide (TPR) repeat protein
MMPVVKDPLMSVQGKSESVTNRTVVVVPFSSDRPAAAASSSAAAQAAAQAAAPAQTPEMQEEMRKLIDAARAAVADLQAATPTQPVEAPPALPHQAVAPVVYPTGAPAPPYPYPEQTSPPPGYAPLPPGYNPLQDVHAHQALEAATAMARATTALGQLAAASSGFSGMLPTVHATEGAPGPAGASRRIQAVIESIITRRGLSLRLAPALTEAFEGAELKASDYASQTKISKDSAGRELRLATESGLLQAVRYPQGEAGFRASQGLLREIAEGLGQPINAAAPLTAETIIGSLAVGQTEGTVTIMFTDVEESTRLLSTRGFTASHEIMRAYETIIDEKIAEHAGRRIKGLGDGFMISFGSARHGVECALDIQHAIADYSKQNPERKLRIRIGLNTGEVVEEAGDIFGAAVNVAARVAGKARGGEILVSDIVRQLVGPTAEMKFAIRGRYKLKGFPDRWRLHQVTPGEVKETSHVLASDDGFVDREQERLDIRMVMDRATMGSGSLVFLTGAAGIGTSRLASEVATEAAAKGWLVLTGRSLEKDAEPYGPFRDVLAGAVTNATAKVLNEAVGTHGPLLATLAPMLRQKVRGMGTAHEVAADKVREQLFKAIHALLTGVQGNKPLLIVLDDLQWADEPTVMLLRDLAERVIGSRIVVLGTCWDSELDSGRPFATVMSRLLRRRRAQRIVLNRLSDQDVERIVAGMAESPLTPVQMLGIQAATEGNPLFVEHSFLYMAESESMLGGARPQASYTEEDLELAQSVRGLIGRRIQRLSEPAQRMLVAAGIIGRDFDIPLLEAFGELSGHELRDALDEATRGHFLAAAGKGTYRFAHDLVRQRALAALPLPRLQAYHLAVADTLERVYGKFANEHAAEIGYHLYQAGTAADPFRTAEFLGQAAQNALAVGAFEEVLRLVDSTLQLLPPDKTRERAEGLSNRAQALWGLGRHDDAKAAWQGAVQRYEELGDTKATSSMHRRIARLETRGGQGVHNGSSSVEAPAPEAEPVS